MKPFLVLIRSIWCGCRYNHVRKFRTSVRKSRASVRKYRTGVRKYKPSDRKYRTVDKKVQGDVFCVIQAGCGLRFVRGVSTLLHFFRQSQTQKRIKHGQSTLYG
jgi:hypothetical protein